MGAKVSVNVLAKAKGSSKPALNFTKGCYSEDVNLSLLFKTDSSQIRALDLYAMSSSIKEEGKINGFRVSSAFTAPSRLDFKIDKEFFDKGKSAKIISINFDRDKNTPIEPIYFKALNVTLKLDESNITTLANLNKTINFYYLRSYVPTPRTLSKSETIVDILPLIYCKNCDKSKLTKKIIDSSNLIYWYITDINDKLVTDIDSLVTSSSPKELSILKKISFDKIKVKAGKLPLKVRIYYTPSYSWLLFDRYNKNVSRHYFDLYFTSVGKWAGEGSLGTTIDTNISPIPNETIDW
jgi:hypothetical protein